MAIIKQTRDENGNLHSFNDEPAIIYDDGDMYWFKHGLKHRDNDLPAIIWSNGVKYWCKQGKIHRETNAAVIRPNHIKGYWLNGEEYTFDEWIKLTPISEEDKIALLLEK
jgi:hypothetical protein